MTEHERFMYQVLGKISETDAPIVFKGALITKLVLAENGVALPDRPTIDIDANWTGSPPSMEYLVNTIQQSLGDMSDRLYAVAIREYEEKKSAGISIRTKNTDEEIMSMDISIKPVIDSKIYHYGEISIKGVVANEILADKITVLSKQLVFRRAKDLFDVYALALCLEVRTSEIFDVLKSKSASLGEFAEFYNRRNDLEHAYNKLRRIDGKPPFDEVYSYLKIFIQPFAERDMAPKVWNSRRMTWDDDTREKKPSILEALRKYKVEITQKDKGPDRQYDNPKHKGNLER